MYWHEPRVFRKLVVRQNPRNSATVTLVAGRSAIVADHEARDVNGLEVGESEAGEAL